MGSSTHTLPRSGRADKVALPLPLKLSRRDEGLRSRSLSCLSRDSAMVTLVLEEGPLQGTCFAPSRAGIWRYISFWVPVTQRACTTQLGDVQQPSKGMVVFPKREIPAFLGRCQGPPEAESKIELTDPEDRRPCSPLSTSRNIDLFHTRPRWRLPPRKQGMVDSPAAIQKAIRATEPAPAALAWPSCHSATLRQHSAHTLLQGDHGPPTP